MPRYDRIRKRWYDASGKVIPLGKGFWDRKSKRYIMYGSDGTTTKYTIVDWAKKKNHDIVTRRKQLEKQYSIPATNRVTLTQRGRKTPDRGAKVSQQQVDSILKYANIVGIPYYEALGLAAQESTFNLSNNYGRGNGYFYDRDKGNLWVPKYDNKLSGRVSPVTMISDWSYINDNPYNDFLTTVEKVQNPREREQRALDGRAYMDKQASKFTVEVPPLQHGFELYKSGRYNAGDKNYNNTVRERGNNLRNSPELVKMVNNSEYRKK